MNNSCICFLGPRLAAGTVLSRHEQDQGGGRVDVFMCGAGAAGGSQQGDRYHRYLPLSYAPARARAHTHTH
jgi:hypothetical protein